MKPRSNAPYCAEKLNRVPNDEFSNLAFLDAYFSNLIEGTRFKVSETHEIVFDGTIPDARPADAHDVLDTFRLVGSVFTMTRSVRDFTGFGAFVDALRSAYSEILSTRPEKRPGQFKMVVNGAGETEFVEPALVAGTLRHILEIARNLEEPFQRAAAMMFVLSEIHPFDDGNGRIARAFMNAERIGGGERRILFPIDPARRRA